MSIVVFVLSLLLFGGYLYKEKFTKDLKGPEITMETDHIQISVNDDTDALLDGVAASDERDGDLSDAVRVEAVDPFNEDGSRIVRYVVFDSDGHVTHALRTMSYTDYTEPVFEITKPLAFPTDTVNLLEGVTAQDCLDGDVSNRIQILFDGETDKTKPGVYPARLKVKNSAGGTAEIPVTYEIYNTEDYSRLPKVNLNEYLVRLEKGEKFNAADYLRSVVIGNAEYSFVKANGGYGASHESDEQEKYTIDQSFVTVNGEVDTDTPGCYEVIYSFNDEVFGTGTGTTRLYVVITEGGTE